MPRRRYRFALELEYWQIAVLVLIACLVIAACAVALYLVHNGDTGTFFVLTSGIPVL